jgi:hypothetical protein
LKPGSQLSASELEQVRRSYVPAAQRHLPPLVFLDGQVTAWAVPYVRERIAVLIFLSKQAKPIIFCTVRSLEEAAKMIQHQVASSSAWLAHRAKDKAERAAKLAEPHGLKVGQVLVSSWGYDQTNVDFYEIAELVGKRSAKIAKIRGMVCEGAPENDYGDRGKTMPSDSPDRRIGEPFLVRIGPSGSVKVDHHYARPWDGAPLYWSSYA